MLIKVLLYSNTSIEKVSLFVMAVDIPILAQFCFYEALCGSKMPPSYTT